MKSLGILALAAAAGCTQVLGLDGYAQAPLESSDAQTEAGRKDGAASHEGGEADSGRHDGHASTEGDGAPDLQEASIDVRAEQGVEAGVDGAVEADAAEESVASCASMAGYACAPEAPSGWVGPLSVYEAVGLPLPAVPACAGAYATDAYDGVTDPSGPPATCGCSCGAPALVECQASVGFFKDGACHNSCGTPATLTPGVCTSVSTSGCPLGGPLESVSLTASGGSCSPSATTAVAPLTWDREVRACALATPASAVDCGASEVCVPVPMTPFETGNLCVARAGAWACPAAFPAQRTYYTGAEDTRGCSACTCGAPSGVSCSGSLTGYLDSSCKFTGATAAVAETCGDLDAIASIELTAAPSGGSCGASPVAATGGVTPGLPTTLCCQE